MMTQLHDIIKEMLTGLREDLFKKKADLDLTDVDAAYAKLHAIVGKHGKPTPSGFILKVKGKGGDIVSLSINSDRELVATKKDGSETIVTPSSLKDEEMEFLCKEISLTYENGS